MGKTYKLLDHTEPMTIDEIGELYDGYWVFITNVQRSEEGRVVSGVPAVVGIMAYDGAEDDVFDQFWADEYGECVDRSFMHNQGFISALQIVGD